MNAQKLQKELEVMKREEELTKKMENYVNKEKEQNKILSYYQKQLLDSKDEVEKGQIEISKLQE